MKYELVPCDLLAAKHIEAFLDEFTAAGEYCNAMWKAHEIGVAAWKKEVAKDVNPSEHILAFLVDTKLVGVVRVTPNPNHVENGKIGFYIRPSKRKQKYAPSMIRLAEDFCLANGIDNITAVADVRNVASAKAMFAAGWTRSGKQYVWTSGRSAIEFQPKPCGK